MVYMYCLTKNALMRILNLSRCVHFFIWGSQLLWDGSSKSHEETWEHVSVHWQQGKYQLWANCLVCWNPVLNACPRVPKQHFYSFHILSSNDSVTPPLAFKSIVNKFPLSLNRQFSVRSDELAEKEIDPCHARYCEFDLVLDTFEFKKIWWWIVNILRLERNDQHFADDFFSGI